MEEKRVTTKKVHKKKLKNVIVPNDGDIIEIEEG